MIMMIYMIEEIQNKILHKNCSMLFIAEHEWSKSDESSVFIVRVSHVVGC